MLKSKVPYEMSSIVLENGWSGWVLRNDGAPTGSGREAGSLPGPGDWETVLNRWLSDEAGQSEHVLLKHSPTGQVRRARLGWPGGFIEAVFKQSQVIGVRRRWVAALTGSRERRNFHFGLALRQAGVPTAQPLALLERRGPTRQAWLVTEFVPAVVDLDRIVLVELLQLDGRTARAVKLRITRAIADLLVHLDRSGFRHRDLKASNILLANWKRDDLPARALLIDLDGLRRRRLWNRRARWQPLTRLAASLLGYSAITRTDYLRFARTYLSSCDGPIRGPSSNDSLRRQAKVVFRRLQAAATDYARRSQGRKAGKLDGYTGE